ncbi:Glp-like protein [Favolaschia claudopus]|uniref:Glp-like protein n=1 Tax=Favolaschia claudopus TaxID=2862362 RepID=A0AAW0E0H2_9AGAR
MHMAFTLLSTALLALTFATDINVCAESHTVKFDNRCGFGTPKLIQGGHVLTTTSYTSPGQISAAIAYLQTGDCLFNGEKCTLLELTMVNPLSVGGGSSADISLIDPHTFSVSASIEFYGGCDGIRTTCDAADCNTAFRQPDDTWVQIACQENNANLLITFCPNSSNGTTTTHDKTTLDAQTTAHTDRSTKTSSAVRTSKPTTSASTSSQAVNHAPSSAPVCKHKHAERRALSAHRKRGAGRRLHLS